MSHRTASHSLPNVATQRRILAEQGNCCFYCGLPLDSYVYRRGRLIPLQRHWDHLVPWTWTHNRECVAACQLCNHIKANKLFETAEDAQRYVLAKWAEKGYRLARDRDISPTPCWDCGRLEPCRCPERYARAPETA